MAQSHNRNTMHPNYKMTSTEIDMERTLSNATNSTNRMVMAYRQLYYHYDVSWSFKSQMRGIQLPSPSF